MAYGKLYELIGWKDRPARETLVSRNNLGKMDTGIDKLDNRIVEMSKREDDLEERLENVETEVIPIKRGGTGGTTAKAAQYNLLNDTSASDTVINDTATLGGIYLTPTEEKGAFYRVTILKLWEHFKSKISSILGLTATNYAGTSAKATADADGNVIADTYVTKEDIGIIANAATITFDDNSDTISATQVETRKELAADFKTFEYTFEEPYTGNVYITNPSGSGGTVVEVNCILTLTYADVETERIEELIIKTGGETEKNVENLLKIEIISPYTVDSIEIVDYESDAVNYKLEVKNFSIDASKLDPDLGLDAKNYSGTSAKATADADGNDIVETYATKEALSKIEGKNEWKLVSNVTGENVITLPATFEELHIIVTESERRFVYNILHDELTDEVYNYISGGYGTSATYQRAIVGVSKTSCFIHNVYYNGSKVSAASSLAVYYK